MENDQSSLKEDFEIEPVPAVVVSEKNSVLRVGDIVVNGERVEMIRQIEACY